MTNQPKYHDIQEVDDLLGQIAQLESQHKDLQKSHLNLVETNKLSSSKLLNQFIQDIEHKLDRDLQVEQLNKLRLQESGIKSQLYSQSLIEVESALSSGLYQEFIKEIFASLKDVSQVQAGPQLASQVPKQFQPTESQKGTLIVLAQNKEYDLSPEPLQKELARVITINKLKNLSQKNSQE